MYLCICPSCRQFMIRIYYSYEVSIFFLPLSSRYLELPSIHARSSHFRQAIEYSQVEESSFYKVDVQAAKWKWINATVRQNILYLE